MSKKKSIITEFNETGNCIVDINEVAKQWTDKWIISQWNEEYRLVTVNPNSKIGVKLTISKEQAISIIDKLELACEKSITFRSGKTWSIIVE